MKGFFNRLSSERKFLVLMDIYGAFALITICGAFAITDFVMAMSSPYRQILFLLAGLPAVVTATMFIGLSLWYPYAKWCMPKRGFIIRGEPHLGRWEPRNIVRFGEKCLSDERRTRAKKVMRGLGMLMWWRRGQEVKECYPKLFDIFRAFKEGAQLSEQDIETLEQAWPPDTSFVFVWCFGPLWIVSRDRGGFQLWNRRSDKAPSQRMKGTLGASTHTRRP